MPYFNMFYVKINYLYLIYWKDKLFSTAKEFQSANNALVVCQLATVIEVYMPATCTLPIVTQERVRDNVLQSN